ncbi:hypothetical protein BLNAU_17073 [Blattamonas nauphoetae]|uniref:Uncharacterized protein n=1 Tax=Blattamonas nauphoetae TaxID=2049346 RepID=A0ABQ9X7W9_9EUKA|nr:hypothetical protein BLNAU_17073 [Blattamonas nauphoetae]
MEEGRSSCSEARTTDSDQTVRRRPSEEFELQSQYSQSDIYARRDYERTECLPSSFCKLDQQIPQDVSAATWADSNNRHTSPYLPTEANTVDGCHPSLRVGILGETGTIGQDITRRIYALGATVVGAGRKERKEGEKWLQRQVESEWDKRLPKASDSFSSFISLEGDDAQHQNKLRAFLKDLDVIVNVLPSTSETHYLLGWRQIEGVFLFSPLPSFSLSSQEQMDSLSLSVCKPSSILVNVGRGIVICEAAVCSAPQQGIHPTCKRMLFPLSDILFLLKCVFYLPPSWTCRRRASP